MQNALDASRSQLEIEDRIQADVSSKLPVLAFFTSSVFWLLFGSFLGLIASFKFNYPDWLNQSALLTFGRIRPLHLNVVAYGWSSMAGIGVALWLVPRLFKTPLRHPLAAFMGALVWNLGMVLGVAALFLGWTDGLEWLEFPWQTDTLFVAAGLLVSVSIFDTIWHRKVEHLYVSSWYIMAAFIWFPILFVFSNVPYLHFGVEQAAANWWYAHNVLGLWLTPFALGAAYYFIPKVIGRPIYSYQLSLLGFWSLALFYSHAGIHHLIGGPVPTWLATVGIVGSVSMVIPVIAVAINHHMTIWGHFKSLKYSPTLRFIVPGAIMYTLVSLQGSLEATRGFNTLAHFTHYTIAHAHLGVYGFFSYIMFGSMYFILPRVTGWEWPSQRLISAHFWLISIGFGIYFIFLTLGGILQGLILLDGSKPFMESVIVTLPYLMARSVGGTLMTLGHIVFAWHLMLMLFHKGPDREKATLLSQNTQEVSA